MTNCKKKSLKRPLLIQAGQSMTQYLILLFLLAMGAIVTVGYGSQATRNQVAAVSHEITGNHIASKASISKSQQNSKYASTEASLPNTLGVGSSSNSPVINPTGPNTVPAVDSNTNPSTDPNNPIINPGTPSTGTPSTGTPSTGTPSTGTPSTGTPSTGTPSTGTPSTGTPSTGTPSTGTPSTGTPSTGTPSTGTPSTGGTGILPPPLCTKTTPEEDDGSTKTDEDQGFWGSLWDEVKDGLVAGYEFVKGFWEGMKKQVADLGELLANPIETAQGLIELGKQFVKEPAKTAKMIADSLGEEFSTLVHCGAFDKGRVIGENVSPAFMVKLATKMAKLGDLSKALTATKKDFGCASFAAGTPIWTPQGKVNIESLTKGNTVLSRDRQSYKDKPQKILKTFGRTAPNYYQLTTEFGTLKVTEEHPMWKQGRGWTEAQYLKVDDVVASAEGDVLILDNLKIEKPLQVYNFSVNKTPNYFAGKSKLWVHNAKCDLFPTYKDANGKTIRTPVEGKIGNWLGKRGNSKFQPKQDTPLYEATGGKPIELTDGYPKFDVFAPKINGKSAIVEIDMKRNHTSDFTAARNAMREKLGDPNWNPDYSKYTWHHHQDGKTMILIDKRIHNQELGGIPHAGGCSTCPGY